MALYVGRGAGNTVSTPTLGHPQQRVQANAMKQAQQSTRQRQIYSLFSGGTSNRLLLSIRSGLPQEIDYALEILLQTSYSDAPLIPLEMLPGLQYALLDLVSPSPAKDVETARRQLEAALVIRNLVLEGGPRAVEYIRTVVDFIFEILVEILREQDEAQAELQLYLLDIAEVYAGSYTLSLPSSAPAESRMPSQQLYPLLAQLAQSNDRALIIGAYTLLGALAMNKQNEPVFAFRSPSSPSTSAQQPECPTSMLAHRALLLTSVNDGSLLLPVLEFLYQHTSVPSNSSQVLIRRDLRDIFPLIASRIKEGTGVETWEHELVQGNKSKRGQDVRKALLAAYPVLASQDPNRPSPDPTPRLSSEEMQKIITNPEPMRAREWMKGVFEPSEGAEITQVALWQTYQKQFEAFHEQMKAGQVPAMLSASDVIKSSSEAYPTALPKVIEENGVKRFVITGIKARLSAFPKDPAEERAKEKWKCRWSTCSDKPIFGSAVELHKHLESMHVGYQDGTQTCLFSGCGQSATSARELRFHLRTHVLPSGPQQASSTESVQAADAQDKAACIFTDTSIQPQTNQSGYATGIGFVACLVLRNLARAVAAATARYRKKEAESNMDVDGQKDDAHRSQESNGYAEDEGRRREYGFLSGRTTEQDSESGSSVSIQEVDLTKEQLSSALSALYGLEKEIMLVASSNSSLASYLMETLESIVNAKRSTDGLL